MRLMIIQKTLMHIVLLDRVAGLESGITAGIAELKGMLK